jgi:RHH-type rel operon transcriptional repressor/antitoxin RelB
LYGAGTFFPATGFFVFDLVVDMLNLFNMLGIRLEPELEEKLESLAKETGRSKSYYAREAIRQYLEDREDYLKGIAALERREPTITLQELERRLGLAD